MVRLRDIERVVGVERVGVDDAVRLDLFLDDREQSLCSSVRDGRRIDLPATLQQPEKSDFPGGTSTALALPDSAEIVLVRLDLARQLIGRLLACNQDPETLIEANCGVRPNTNDLGCSFRRCSSPKMLNELSLLSVSRL